MTAEPDAATGPLEQPSGSTRLASELLACGFRDIQMVPGSPATDVIEELDRLGARVEDAGDERSAAEVAFGMSLAGRPVAVVVKGSGAFLASETLANATVHTTGAPLLLVVGDDVRAENSTVPTDSRWLGPIVQVPVFDLPDAEALGPTLLAARDVADRARRPALVRFTGGLARSVSRAPSGGSLRPPPAVHPADTESAHAVTKLSRYLVAAVTGSVELERAVAHAPVLHRPGASRTGVVASGMGWSTMVERMPGTREEPALGLTAVHPLPTAALEFCQELDRVLVVEEGRPFLEERLQLALVSAGVACEVLGQRSGHLPHLGAESVQQVLAALDGALAPRSFVVEPRPVTTDPPGEFHELIAAVARQSRERDVEVHSCVGSCIQAAYPPFSVVSSALELGGSISVAAGTTAVTGRPAIALIGDYGLVHSGLEAHDRVHLGDRPVLTIVLANGRSAKTGGQLSSAARSVQGRRSLDLHRVLTRAAEPDRVRVADVDGMTPDQLDALIGELLDRLPSTLLAIVGDAVMRPED